MSDTTLQVNFRGEVERRADATAMLRIPADLVVVRRGRLRLAIIKCPSGCGDEVIVNLDPRAGPNWSFYRRRQGISLYPSVWRDTGCGAHFVIWRSKCFLFDESERDWYSRDSFAPGLAEKVLAQFLDEDEQHFEEIANKLDEVPWTISAVCHNLVRVGKLLEGSRMGVFRRVDVGGEL